MKRSVGIIPVKVVDGELLFFVGHPGGWQREYWAYMKGGVNKGEDEKQTALREFKEESGVDLSGKMSELVWLGFVKQNPNKTVGAFYLFVDDIDPDKCFSNLIEDGFTPEIDRYKWMRYDELKPVTNKAHIQFYDKIIENYKASHAV